MPAGTCNAPSTVKALSSSARNSSPERISELSRELSGSIQNAVTQINLLNKQTRMLSFNAQIEAARSAAAGTTFQVVALAMRDLSGAIADVAESVTANTQATSTELESISNVLATQVRGTRLSDLAMTNIDLIDRNLYERSCDCRWWATDSSLVSALTQRNEEAYRFASKRMGVILNAYTVYFDLVLADLSGNVVANGRPEQFQSKNSNHANAEWFRTAMATDNGEQFGFQSVTESALVNGQRALVYSAGVRKDGDVRGELIGVLGIVFNWDALAQTIVCNTPLPSEEKQRTRVCIIDSSGLLLADSHNQQLHETLQFPELISLLGTKKHYIDAGINDRRYCVAHAKSQGFETYATGWHSLIMQQLDA